jgi:Protein of unknown function (DUF1236)
MKRVLAGLAGAVALAGVSSMGIAQAPEKGERPAAKRDAKQPRATPAPRAARQADRPAARATPAPRAARQADRPAARAPSKLPAAAQRSRPQPRAAAQAEPRQPVERKRAQEGRPADRKIDQQSRQGQDKRAQDQVRQAKPAATTVGPKQVEKDQRRPDVAVKGEPRAQPIARIQATDQQRREVHRGLLRQGKVERITRSGLGIALAVGNHVPRRHRLHRFTPALIALAPLYGAYSYIVVDDTICVVDSSTYAIVDMIEGSIETAGPLPPAPPPPLALALSPEEMRLIYAGVPKDGMRTQLRIRLALGAEIPRSVQLFAFPNALIAQVPQIAAFRYIVVEDDVVIVDPAVYEIAKVISE